MPIVTVTICAGTACVVMDDGRLLQLEEQLPPRLQGRVLVKGARCLELCGQGRALEAPFVLVGGEVLARATVPRIVERLDALLGEPGGPAW
jgi:NADH:ubiquinone oxidoreductase subunit E